MTHAPPTSRPHRPFGTPPPRCGRSGGPARSVLCAAVAFAAAGLLIAPAPAQADEAQPYLGVDTGESPLPAWRPASTGAAPLTAPRLSGADTLASRSQALAIHLGFPYLGVDLGMGLTDPTDVRLGFRTVYGGLARVDLGGRWRVLRSSAGATVALRSAAAYTAFRRGETAMRMTGQRPYGLLNGVVVSGTAGLAVFFLDVGIDLALDPDPPSSPLGGAPAPYELRANVPIHAGIEVAMSGRLAFNSRIGIDFFPGDRDTGEPRALPHLSAGISLIH